MTFSSCNKDIDFTEDHHQSSASSSDIRTISIDDNDDNLGYDAKMILGDSIPNPYNVNRMQQAFDLFNQVISESPFSGKEVSETHYYIKIVLDDIQDLNIIYDIEDAEGSDAPIFFMHPLHLEVLTPGDYYFDIDTSALFNNGSIDMSELPIYTVIDVNYVLPTSLNVEILDKLYKPIHEEHIIKLIAYQLAGWNNYFGGFGLPDNLATLLEWVGDYPEFEGIYPPDFDPDPPQPPGPNTGGGGVDNCCSPNNVTHGRITVDFIYPDQMGFRPVPNLNIKYGRYIWWFNTSTTENGFFCMHKRYNGTVTVKAGWRKNFVSVRERLYEKLGLLVSDHLMKIRRSDHGIRRDRRISWTSDREHIWNKATVHTGVVEYNQYCSQYGIIPVHSAIVWTMPNGDAASNPMLNHFPQLPLLANFVNLSEIDSWRAILHHIILVPINQGIGMLGLNQLVSLPDQIYGLDGNRRRTDRIHQTVFHESSHFSHAIQAGQVFWAKVYADQITNGILQNNPRGNGIQPTAAAGQRIALVEGWADLADVIISLHFYERARIDGVLRNQIFTLQRLEDFHVLDVPVEIDVRFDRGWLLHGLMWDLLDDEVDGVATRRTGGDQEINLIEDEVFIGNANNLFDLSPIFNLLTSGVENTADFRTAVLNAYPAQTTEINALFDSYGY